LLGYDVEIKTSIINKNPCLLNYKYCLCNMKNKKRILQEKEGVLFPKSFGISSKLKDDNFTGFYDDDNQPIFVGDKLKSEWGYEVIVVKDNGYSGKLVCDDKHSCKNIPYDLSRGKGYTK